MPARAQGDLLLSILEDASPVAEFNAAAFIAYVFNKHVQANRECVIDATQAAIHYRIARKCCTRSKCPGTQ
jgi:hypothetical protein